MDDFTHLMQLLEAARQLADLNDLPVLAYLVGVAKEEARSHRFALRDKKSGRIRKS
ncbi:hypothetical protein ACQKGC_07585 [Allorhizobium pseudoryzae]|jgi:hypothetical protein|uniref:hypothetical protein n=1 Tax=Allorhizobium pseudoryzae TaxID=379684 RepID=UPI0013ED6986|nr:hypothetical protein [Allorhizobium pseudoryzae]